PYTPLFRSVYECLQHGIPFITADVGGGPELIHADDRAEVLFPLNPSALCASLQTILERGAAVPRPAFDFAAGNAAWERWHDHLARGGLRELLAACRPPAAAAPEAEPLVSVCIPHFERPAFL